MNWLALTLIFFATITVVFGQLFLKKGMDSTRGNGSSSRRFICFIGAGILSLTISFFLMLGLLQRFDLSYLYPFQGLSVIFTAVIGAMILREKLSLQLVVGAVLISTGIVLVSLS